MGAVMPAAERAKAEAARGFMPVDEGLALYAAAADAPVDGPWLEVGSYCGKSALYLGYAARDRGGVLFALDHHRGSEENQAGWEYHEPDLVDPEIGVMDTLPIFRRTIFDAGLEGTVVALVGDSVVVAAEGEFGAVWLPGKRIYGLIMASENNVLFPNLGFPNDNLPICIP